MTSLNFHHLYYFWIVAREGGISHASDFLDVSPSTISAQIKQLETVHGVQLFDRVGRNLRLSEVGQIAFRYAEEIFALGREMTHAIHGWSTTGPQLLQVGIADAVPKLAATRLLAPALERHPDIRLICREDHPDRLLAELAVHRLDLVLLDSPQRGLPAVSGGGARAAANGGVGDAALSRSLVRGQWGGAPHRRRIRGQRTDEVIR